jgi:hypothetical protein
MSGQEKRAEEGDDDLVNHQRRTTHKRRQQSARVRPLFGAWARTTGQRQAQLPEKAKEIEWLQNVQGIGFNQPTE